MPRNCLGCVVVKVLSAPLSHFSVRGCWLVGDYTAPEGLYSVSDNLQLGHVVLLDALGYTATHLSLVHSRQKAKQITIHVPVVVAVWMR